MTQSLKELALNYRARGYSIIPCKLDKSPFVSWTEYQSRLASEEEIKLWWTRYHDPNIGIVTGAISGICVLDVDIKEGVEGRIIPQTPIALSGGKQLPHYYFRYKTGFASFNYMQNGREFFSLRSGGNYIIAPPSIHSSGGPYLWINGRGLDDIELADPPEWLFEFMSDSVMRELNRDYTYSEHKESIRNLIQRVNERLKFTELLEGLGLIGQSHGRYSSYRCPFHPDGEHSDFIVWDEICGAKDFHDGIGYDPLKFLMKHNGCDFNTALNILKDKTGIDTKPSSLGTVAVRVVNMVEDLGVILFHDEEREAYVRFKHNDRCRTVKVQSRDFKLWVNKEYYDATGAALEESNISTAISNLEAKAIYDGDEHKLNVRIAEHDSAFWYDLGDGRAVRIDGRGWEIVQDPPILFKQFQHQKVQAEAAIARSEEIYQLFDFVRIRNVESQLLFIANLVTSLIPDIPHPIDVFHGVKGASKTTACKIKKELIDPSVLSSMSPPQKPVEFIQTASHHSYFFLDNLSSMPEWLNDALCRIVTGEGISKRRLYTDDSDVIYSVRRSLSLNGINLIATKPDLLDRALLFELEPIESHERRDESELWAHFNSVKPKILGALFTVLSNAKAEYPEIKLEEKPRMADFAHWGCAVARALGKQDEDFIRAYQGNIGIQNTEALEASPVAQIILALMENRNMWEGSPTELLDELMSIAEDKKIDTNTKKFPRDVNWVWRRLQEVNPNLKEVGIKVRRDDTQRGVGGRKIIIINNSINEIEINGIENTGFMTANDSTEIAGDIHN